MESGYRNHLSKSNKFHFHEHRDFKHVIVGFLTTPPTEKKTEGLTVWSLDKARGFFKGGPPNDRPGETIAVKWVAEERDEDIVRFSIIDMDLMGADVGDLVYLSDERKWLGGLKSVHSVFGEPHNDDGIVYITKIHEESGLSMNHPNPLLLAST